MDNLNIFKGFQKPLLQNNTQQPTQETPEIPKQVEQPQQDQYDRRAIAMARAIRKKESNNDYEIGLNGKPTGGSGEIGAYQFMPETYKNYAQNVGLDPNDWSPKNQDEVMYRNIKKDIEDGLSPAQIAAKHNAGAGSLAGDAWKSRVGVNSYGVQYNTPQYVNDVLSNLDEIAKQMNANRQTPQNQSGEDIQNNIEQQKENLSAQGLPVSVGSKHAQPTFAGSIIRDIAKVPVGLLATLGGGLKRIFTGDPNAGVIIKSDYLGDVPDYLTNATNVANKMVEKYKQGDITGTGAVLRTLAGSTKPVVDLALSTPIGEGVGAAGKALSGVVPNILKEGVENTAKGIGGKLFQEGLGETSKQALKSIGRGGALGTGLDIQNQLASGEKVKLGQALTSGAVGGALDLGATTGLPLLAQGLNKLGKSAKFGSKVSGISKVTDEDIAKAYQNVANEYERALPFSPTQKRKEADRLSKYGENVFTTLSKQGIPVKQTADGKIDSSVLDHLDEINNMYGSVADQISKEENGNFNLNEILKDANDYIDKNVTSSTGRKKAKLKIKEELNSLISEGIPTIKNENGDTLIKIDSANRIRQTGNSWTPFNSADPEKIEQSAGYALSNAVRDNVDKYAEIESTRQFNKQWGNIIHAKKELQDLIKIGRTMKTMGGLSGEISRKILTGAAGLHTGGIGGMILSHLGGDYLARIASDPEMRTMFNRMIIEKGEKTNPNIILEQVKKEMDDLINKRQNMLRLPAPSYIEGQPYKGGKSYIKRTEGLLPLGYGRAE